MDRKLSIGEFTQFVEQAERKYPNANVVSIGHGCANNKWYYALFLDVDGKEIRYEIPMYVEESK